MLSKSTLNSVLSNIAVYTRSRIVFYNPRSVCDVKSLSYYRLTVYSLIKCTDPLEVISPKNNLKIQNQATIDPWMYNLTSPMINETSSQGIQIPTPDRLYI